MNLADRIGDVRRRDDGADPPARDAERLRGATDGDGAIGHPRQRRDRDVLTLVVDVLVDLVGDGEGVVALAELRDRGELGARKHPARGIVRRAHDDRASPGAEGFGEPVEIE